MAAWELQTWVPTDLSNSNSNNNNGIYILIMLPICGRGLTHPFKNGPPSVMTMLNLGHQLADSAGGGILPIRNLRGSL